MTCPAPGSLAVQRNAVSRRAHPVARSVCTPQLPACSVREPSATGCVRTTSCVSGRVAAPNAGRAAARRRVPEQRAISRTRSSRSGHSTASAPRQRVGRTVPQRRARQAYRASTGPCAGAAGCGDSCLAAGRCRTTTSQHSRPTGDRSHRGGVDPQTRSNWYRRIGVVPCQGAPPDLRVPAVRARGGHT